MDGRFVPHELAELFRDIFLSERVGTLDLSRNLGGHVRLEFDRGMLQFGEQEDAEGFGQRLVRDGRVSSGALSDVVATGASDRKIPLLLLEKGYLSVESLADTCHDFLSDVLIEPFQWEAGEYRFEEQTPEEPPVEPDVVKTVDAFLRAVRAMRGFDPVRRALHSMESPLLLKPSNAVPVERLNLTPMQGFVLSRIDGTLTLQEVLSMMPQQEEDHSTRFIYALMLLGAVATDAASRPGSFRTSEAVEGHARHEARGEDEISLIRGLFEQTQDASPYATLGVLEGASPDETKVAYEARKGDVQPEKFLESVRNEMRSELRIIEGRIVQAYLALQSATRSSAKAREPQESEKEAKFDVEAFTMRRDLQKTEVKANQEEASRIAEGFFQKAKRYAQQGDHHNCIQYCKLALQQDEKVARYHHLLGESQAKNPDHRWQKMAEQSFGRAAELDPWNAEFLVSLGQFYKNQGLALRARRVFERVLELLPTHPIAIEELASIKK